MKTLGTEFGLAGPTESVCIDPVWEYVTLDPGRVWFGFFWKLELRNFVFLLLLRLTGSASAKNHSPSAATARISWSRVIEARWSRGWCVMLVGGTPITAYIGVPQGPEKLRHLELFLKSLQETKIVPSAPQSCQARRPAAASSCCRQMAGRRERPEFGEKKSVRSKCLVSKDGSW